MAQYSPELLAALRQRYEQTDQPMHALAAEFRIGITTLQSLVRKNGWSPRSQRLRHCPPVLAAPLPPADAGVDLEVIPSHEVTPSPTLPLARGGSEAALADDAIAPAPAAGNETALSTLSPAERLEALVEKEIAAEEATRAALGIRPRSRNEAERCARTIVKLTHALQTIQKLRGGDRAGAREPPVDLEALRAGLARRGASAACQPCCGRRKRTRANRPERRLASLAALLLPFGHQPPAARGAFPAALEIRS